MTTPKVQGGIIAAIGPELAQTLVVGLWASTFIVTKHTFAELTPLAFTFIRFGFLKLLGAGLVLGGLMIIRTPTRSRSPKIELDRASPAPTVSE